MNELADEVTELSEKNYDAAAEEENVSIYDDLNNESVENDIETVDSEINTIINDVNSLKYVDQVKTFEQNRTLDERNIDFNLSSHYNQKRNSFEINFGSDHLPRFSCANHKLNIAVRGAISIHQQLTNILKDLNKQNAHIRRSIQLNYAFKSEKCKLRLENFT